MQLGSVACGSFLSPGSLDYRFPVVLRGKISDFRVLFLPWRQLSVLNPHRASCLISRIFPGSRDFNVYSSEIWLSRRFNEVALVTPRNSAGQELEK